MRRTLLCLLLLAVVLPLPAAGELRAGSGVGNITPPVGTPSAGYGDRLGAGMEGVHDPLLATALLIDNGVRRIALVGVDHLGFDWQMIDDVRRAVHARTDLGTIEIFVGSSHTHAGGGAYLDIPGLGERLAGAFDPAARQLYVDGTVAAIVEAAAGLRPARVGIGYGAAPGLNRYRGDWPPNVEPRDDLAVIKVTSAEGLPLAVVLNYAAHATVLPGRGNMQFSADFVGYARHHLQAILGEGVQPIYLNGAQGDVSPRPPSGEEMFERCDALGRALASAVVEVWNRTGTAAELGIDTFEHTYRLEVEPTSMGIRLPLESRRSELNLLVFDGVHAFVTIPGELSTIYDADVKRFGRWLGFEQVSILGLTNDAHGYIVTPESWRHQTYESTVSFGGELYGEQIKSKVYALLHALEPPGAYQEERAKPSLLLAEPAAATAGSGPP